MGEIPGGKVQVSPGVVEIPGGKVRGAGSRNVVIPGGKIQGESSIPGGKVGGAIIHRQTAIYGPQLTTGEIANWNRVQKSISDYINSRKSDKAFETIYTNEWLISKVTSSRNNPKKIDFLRKFEIQTIFYRLKLSGNFKKALHYIALPSFIDPKDIVGSTSILDIGSIATMLENAISKFKEAKAVSDKSRKESLEKQGQQLLSSALLILKQAKEKERSNKEKSILLILEAYIYFLQGEYSKGFKILGQSKLVKLDEINKLLSEGKYDEVIRSSKEKLKTAKPEDKLLFNKIILFAKIQKLLSIKKKEGFEKALKLLRENKKLFSDVDYYYKLELYLLRLSFNPKKFDEKVNGIILNPDRFIMTEILPKEARKIYLFGRHKEVVEERAAVLNKGDVGKVKELIIDLEIEILLEGKFYHRVLELIDEKISMVEKKIAAAKKDGLKTKKLEQELLRLKRKWLEIEKSKIIQYGTYNSYKEALALVKGAEKTLFSKKADKITYYQILIPLELGVIRLDPKNSEKGYATKVLAKLKELEGQIKRIKVSKENEKKAKEDLLASLNMYEVQYILIKLQEDGGKDVSIKKREFLKKEIESHEKLLAEAVKRKNKDKIKLYKDSLKRLKYLYHKNEIGIILSGKETDEVKYKNADDYIDKNTGELDAFKPGTAKWEKVKIQVNRYLKGMKYDDALRLLEENREEREAINKVEFDQAYRKVSVIKKFKIAYENYRKTNDLVSFLSFLRAYKSDLVDAKIFTEGYDKFIAQFKDAMFTTTFIKPTRWAKEGKPYTNIKVVTSSLYDIKHLYRIQMLLSGVRTGKGGMLFLSPGFKPGDIDEKSAWAMAVFQAAKTYTTEIQSFERAVAGRKTLKGYKETDLQYTPVLWTKRDMEELEKLYQKVHKKESMTAYLNRIWLGIAGTHIEIGSANKILWVLLNYLKGERKIKESSKTLIELDRLIKRLGKMVN